MKKKIIIAVSGLAVVALAVTIWFVYSNRAYIFGEDLSKYVPKNAAFVAKVDLIGLGKKLDVKEVSESNDFKNLLDEIPKTQREIIKEVIKDPKMSGLNIASAPLLFAFNETEDQPIVAFLFGITDNVKLKKFITDLSDDNIKLKEPDADGFYKVAEEDNVGFYFNDKIGIILVDADNHRIDLKKVRDKIAKMEKANSILSNEDYATVNKQTNDIMVYLNKKELPSFYKYTQNNTGMSNKEAEAIASEAFKLYPYAYTINFIEDAITFKTYSSTDKDAPAILREGGLTDNELKNLAPNGSPLGYVTLNMDFKKLIDLGYSFAKLIPGNPLSSESDPIEKLATELKVSKNDLLNIFQGKMSIAFAGAKMVSKTDEFSLTTINQPVPLVNAWVSLGNKDAAVKILETAVTNGALVNNGGIYSKNGGSGADVFVAIKGNDLLISTDADAINNKMQGTDWSTLNASLGKTNASSKPATFFVDLRYSSIKDLVDNADPSSARELETYKSVLSDFKEISGYSDNKGSEMTLKFTEQKTNSLKRIVQIFQKAALMRK
jgi:hypothetical protein